MRRKPGARHKSDVTEPVTSGSNAVMPGTAQSGASDPDFFSPGASEVESNSVESFEPGTAQSGAVEYKENGVEHTEQKFDGSTSFAPNAVEHNGLITNSANAAGEAVTEAVTEADLISERLLNAHNLTQEGELTNANAIYEQVLAEIGNQLKPDESTDSLTIAVEEDRLHIQIVDCLWNLANNLYVLNEVEQSIPLFKKLVAIQELKLGPESDELITPLLRLAIALKRAGEATESESTFERSMNLAKRVNPEGNLAAIETRERKGEPETKLTGFVHPLMESTQARDLEGASGLSQTGGAPDSAPIASGSPDAPEDAEADVLKYLFSDNAPAHVIKQMSDIKPDKPSTGRSNVLSRSNTPVAPIDYEKGYIDRNPAATRLSELDIASLGAIPSPDAMKTMFRDATFSDPQVRNTRSTAFLKANEGTDEPVKFADSVKRFDAKESTPFLIRNRWLLPVVALSVVVFAVVFAAKNFLSKDSSANTSLNAQALSQPIKSFASFDQETVLQLFKNSTANFTTNNKSHRSTCYFLDGDLRDLFRVLPGSYSGNDVWMQQTNDGLRQPDGVMLYAANAPVTAVVKQMTQIAQLMQAYYGIHRSYPTTVEQFQEALGTSVYINPFSHKGDPPKFFMTYSSSIGTSAKKLETKTEAGENWINETTSEPGEIHCCSLIYEDPAGHQPADMVVTGAPGTSGNGTDFFIRGGDVDNHFIAGSKPGSTFYIELNQGKSSELSTIINGPSKPLDLAKMRILIAKDFSEQTLFLLISGAVPALLVMGIGGGWFIQHQLYEEKDALSQTRKKVVTQVLIVCSVLLAIWVAVCALG